MAATRPAWGAIRKLPSGRYQARYRLEGIEYLARFTFATKREASAFLARVRADVDRGTWSDPFAGKVKLADYAWRWLDERPNLRPRTHELYESELKLHILPRLGGIEIADLTPGKIRTWHAGLLKADRPGPTTVAKCYRLLRSILNTAVEDGMLPNNPCAIKGAGVEHHAERPVATVEQVFQLADAIEPRYRAMVLLAGFTGLRLGELLALSPREIDLASGTVKVTRQLQELAGGGHFEGPPKSNAGRRTVAIPPVLLPMLADHIATSDNRAYVFGGSNNRPLRRATFAKAWHGAVEAVGLPELRFHDLRHTGNALAAATGASTKELMARLGHSSPRAALIYQRASRERDAAIAQALSDTIIKAVGPVSAEP